MASVELFAGVRDRQNANKGWQAIQLEHPLQKRLEMQLDSQDFSDCIFKFSTQNGRSLRAHRLILGAVSPVFRTMLMHPWGGSGQIICINDIDYDTFYDLLIFAYTDKIYLRNCLHAANLLYGFKKYMIDEGAKICRQYISKEVCIDDAVSTYLFCKEVMKDDDISEKILKYICLYPFVILKRSLSILNDSFLKAILEQESMNIQEEELANIIAQWSLAVCGYPTPENCRLFLQQLGIVHQIRFLCIVDIERVIKYLPYFMNEREIECLMKQRNTNKIVKDYKFCLNAMPRLALPYNKMTCMRTIEHQSPCLEISAEGTLYRVRVMCSKTIILSGITVPTRCCPDWNVAHAQDQTYIEDIMWGVDLDQREKPHKYSYHIKKSATFDSTIFIKTDNELIMDKDVSYEIWFEWRSDLANENNKIKYRPNKRCDSTNAGVKIKFTDLNTSSFLLGLTYHV